MQKRSRDVADNFYGKQTPASTKDAVAEEVLPRAPKAIKYPAELHPVSKHNMHAEKSRTSGIKSIRDSLFSVFGRLSDEDYEKMFILSLCLLLTNDGADDSLIISLMYLLS